MTAFSDFMIAISSRYLARRIAGLHAPEIGQLRHVLDRGARGFGANMACGTFKLMPDGNLSLTDCLDDREEVTIYMGNILTQDFDALLQSKVRRDYLRKQATCNNNPECLVCDYADRCLMEFWKPNRSGDDCFGAKRFIDWAHKQVIDRQQLGWNSASTCI